VFIFEQVICVFFVSIFELTVDLWVSYFQFIGTALLLSPIGILIFSKALFGSLEGKEGHCWERNIGEN